MDHEVRPFRQQNTFLYVFELIEYVERTKVAGERLGAYTNKGC
jgi:hypothetical protein